MVVQNDHFCLRSNCFDNHIRTFWQHFQDEHNFCDVTLACEDKQIKAHRMVISSFSPVLKNIVKLNHQIEHTFFYLRRIKFGDLQNLVNFMYQGESLFMKECAIPAISVTTSLQIPVILINMLRQSMKEFIIHAVSATTKQHKNLIL